jgi:hypothetical protein
LLFVFRFSARKEGLNFKAQNSETKKVVFFKKNLELRGFRLIGKKEKEKMGKKAKAAKIGKKVQTVQIPFSI